MKRDRIALICAVLCYLLSFVLNFAVFITPVHNNRGGHLGIHPGWISFALSVMLLASFLFLEWFSERGVVGNSVWLGLLLLGILMAVPSGGALELELGWSYALGFVILALHMPFYGLSALFDAGTYQEPAGTITYIHEDRFTLLLLVIFIGLFAYHIFLMIRAGKGGAIWLRFPKKKKGR